MKSTLAWAFLLTFELACLLALVWMWGHGKL